MDEAPVQTSLERFLRAQLALRPGIRCLDAGCGSGAALSTLHSLVHPDGLVVGVDIDGEALEAADNAVWALPNVVLVQADARRLPWPAATFDASYASLLLLWSPQPADTIADLVRVTRPAGRLALVDVDLSTMRFEPALPLWARFTSALTSFQRSHGFDGEIGRSLYYHCVRLGLEDVEVRANVTISTHGAPGWRAAWQLLTGNLSSMLVQEGFLQSSELEELRTQATRCMAMPGALFVAGITYAVSGRVQKGRT